MQIVLAILAVLIGYLLGSFLPAYFIAKAKGIDITKHPKYKNPGTMTAFRLLGIIPGIITAIYDIGKGILALVIAQALTASFIVSIIAGAAAVIGHAFPFYLKRGGKSGATLVGLLGYFIIPPALKIMPLWIFISSAIIVALLFIFLKLERGGLYSLAIISFLIVYFGRNTLDLTILIVPIILSILIIYMGLKDITKKMSREEKSLLMRKILRPAAVVFPIALLFLDKWFVLIIALIVFLFFVVMEILRFVKPKFKYFLFKYKKTEKRRISSMTLLLFSIVLTILIFDKYIASLALLFLILGDLGAWAIGKAFGKIKVLDKTLEGTIACFVICALIAFIFFKIFQFNLIIGIMGAFVATLIELYPIQDDNLTIPLVSAVVMTILSFLIF